MLQIPLHHRLFSFLIQLHIAKVLTFVSCNLNFKSGPPLNSYKLFHNPTHDQASFTPAYHSDSAHPASISLILTR